jgi:hypothetical protein
MGRYWSFYSLGITGGKTHEFEKACKILQELFILGICPNTVLADSLWLFEQYCLINDQEIREEAVDLKTVQLFELLAPVYRVVDSTSCSIGGSDDYKGDAPYWRESLRTSFQDYLKVRKSPPFDQVKMETRLTIVLIEHELKNGLLERIVDRFPGTNPQERARIIRDSLLTRFP